jgi:hypothetical protein
MIRIVLAAEPDGYWRIYRQPQWIGVVRDRPEAATWSKIHWDIDERQYRDALAAWPRDGLDLSREAAIAALVDRGAVEVRLR